MREFIESQVSPPAFAACWPDTAPPYGGFLDTACDKLSGKISLPVTKFTCSLRACGDQRIRLDGKFTDAHGDKAFYLELVWLPRFRSYRGDVNVWNSLPPPAPKSVAQFIAALAAITEDDDEMVFEGQVYDAVGGVDQAVADIDRAFPAIFDLFERFPEGDFGNPGPLVHLLEARGGYHDLLADSLHRHPSIPAVTMVNRLLNSPLPTDERTRWLNTLQAVSSSSANADVRDHAQHFLVYQASRTNTE